MLLRAISHRRLRAFAAIAGVSALVFLHAPEWVKPGQTPLHPRSDISWLDLPDYYLPHLATMEHAAFLSNQPINRFAEWTFVQRYRDKERFELLNERLGRSQEKNRERFAAWLLDTRAEALVEIESQYLDRSSDSRLQGATPALSMMGHFSRILSHGALRRHIRALG